jgi:hypothetical protein
MVQVLAALAGAVDPMVATARACTIGLSQGVHHWLIASCWLLPNRLGLRLLRSARHSVEGSCQAGAIQLNPGSLPSPLEAIEPLGRP